MGMDRMLKVNTVKRSTMSPFRQGSFWYGAILAISEKRLKTLMDSYADVVAEQTDISELSALSDALDSAKLTGNDPIKRGDASGPGCRTHPRSRTPLS